MPIDWVLLGVWAGINALRVYARQQEEEERRKNIVVGVSWTLADEVGGAPSAVSSQFRQLLSGDFGWHVNYSTDGELSLWRGEFSLKTVPTDRDLSWDEVPITLTANFSRAGLSKTRVELKFAAPSAVEFNRECQQWFYDCAKHESSAIFEHGRHRCPLWVKVGWNGRLTFPPGWPENRTAVRSVLCNGLRWSHERSDPHRDAFRRGNAILFAASSNGRVKWVDLPMTLEVTVESTSPSQCLVFRFLADEGVEFDHDLNAFFEKSAETELDSILERLKEFHRRTQYEAEEEEEEDDEDPADDSDEEVEDDADDDTSNDDDDGDDDLDAELTSALETLGLTDAATWREVQTKYRQLAKKYHPDAHSSRGLTPEQRKNLEREFSKATAAYDRLRDFFHD
ncbi:MAG: hypothetical protein AMXMBFR47_02910 [Planctomycetota bacterium]